MKPAISKAFTSGLFASDLTRRVTLKYLLHLPDGYEAGRAWPLTVFLHGAGERGTDERNIALNGLPKLAREGRSLPFILLAPLCPANQCWDDDAILALVETIQREYKVDANRIYLTGLSMGGFGTWSLLVNHPEKWAAAAPICGGGSVIGVQLASAAKLRALKKLPVHAYHGAKDDVVPARESERMIEALERAGCRKARLTLYPEADHDSWRQTYADERFHEWLLAQKKAQSRR